jgi:hypothetical protein
LQWDNGFGSTYQNPAYSVIKINDGDYIVTGTTDSYHKDNTDFWLKLEENTTEPEETGPKPRISGFLILNVTGSLAVAYIILRNIGKK